MQIFDVTRAIENGMPVFPGDPEVSIVPWLSTPGSPVNVSRLTFGSHTGTHVDAPSHLDAAASGVDQLPLEVLVGPTCVYALSASPIDVAALQGVNLTAPRALFKRRPGEEIFSITEGAARLLVTSGIQLVGVEAMSVDAPESETLPAHRLLLQAGVIILEGLDLSAVPPGQYELLCLPLRLRRGDGAPARVLLRTLR